MRDVMHVVVICVDFGAFLCQRDLPSLLHLLMGVRARQAPEMSELALNVDSIPKPWHSSSKNLFARSLNERPHRLLANDVSESM